MQEVKRDDCWEAFKKYTNDYHNTPLWEAWQAAYKLYHEAGLESLMPLTDRQYAEQQLVQESQRERCIADDQWAIDAFYEGYDKANADFKANGFCGLKPIIGGIRSLLAAVKARPKRESGTPAKATITGEMVRRGAVACSQWRKGEKLAYQTWNGLPTSEQEVYADQSLSCLVAALGGTDEQGRRESVSLKELVDWLEERVDFPGILSEHLLERFEIRRKP